jgi:prevent-host-death family protein
MFLDSSKIIPVTKLQKELTKKVREVTETGEPLYVMKNNNMEAVLLPFEAYENLRSLEELFEQIEIENMLEKRLASYSPDNNVSWKDIREK